MDEIHSCTIIKLPRFGVEILHRAYESGHHEVDVREAGATGTAVWTPIVMVDQRATVVEVDPETDEHREVAL